jgi:exosortase
LLSLLWFLLVRVNIQAGHQVLLPVVLLATYAALYGVPLAKRCVFPIGYLYFAIPIWGAINGLFQWGTVFAVRLLLRVFGIPVYFQGSELHLPAGVLAVEGGCSGLHFFVVAMAIAVLYWRLYAIQRPVMLLVLAASLAVLTNWLRVFVIAVAGYLTDMQHYLIRVDHYRFGWVLFAVAMIAFFVLAGRMTGSLRVQSVASKESDAKVTMQWGGIGLLPVLFALAIGPIAQWTLRLRDQNQAIAHSTITPPAEWSVASTATSNWHPVFVNADFSDLTVYRRDAIGVEVFRALYTDQRQEKKLSGYSNSIAGTGYQHASGELAAPPPLGFSRSVLAESSGKQWVVLHTYFVGQKTFAQPLPAQMYYGVSSIFSPKRIGVIAVRSECVPTCAAADALLLSFVDTLNTMLATTSDLPLENH